MIEDLQYEKVQRMKRWEGDSTYESFIAAFDFPLVVNGDWNPYIFKLTKTTKEDFLACPDTKKIPYIIKHYIMNSSKTVYQPYFDRFRDYRINVLGVD